MANDPLSFQISGEKELNAKLKGLNRETKFKGGRFALRKAANIVKNAAVSNALAIDDPETAEQIAKNIVIRWGSRRFKSTGDLMFRVGVLGGARPPQSAKQQRRNARRRGAHGRSLEQLGEVAGRGKGNPGGDTFYWRYLEFGTEKMPAHPFMRKSLSDNIENATNEFVRQYNRAIDRALKRAGK